MTTTGIAERIRGELGELAVDSLTRDLRARLDEWLAADKAFNTWFLVTTKRPLTDDDLMGLLDGYRESQELVEEAWDAFVDTKDAAALEKSLVASIDRMRTLQGR